MSALRQAQELAARLKAKNMGEALTITFAQNAYLLCDLVLSLPANTRPEGERCAYCKQPMDRVCDSCDKGFYEGQPPVLPAPPPLAEEGKHAIVVAHMPCDEYHAHRRGCLDVEDICTVCHVKVRDHA